MNPSALALAYAQDVVAGKVVAGHYAKLACQRFLDDLKRIGTEGFPYTFEWDRADQVIEFQQTLPHTKGQWAARGQLLVYEPWQCFIEANVFGWVYAGTDRRRFRESYEEVARKNGKSLRIAARGVYLFCADGVYGAEVFSGATTERQAWEIFRPARQMIQRTPPLQREFDIEINAKNLVILSNGSRFEPLIGKPGDGSAPSAYLCDEFHEHPDADQYETMLTGMGSRYGDGGGPLASIITTAGSNLSGPCYAKRQDAIKVLEGSVIDETLFAVIYCADESDEWDSIEALEKANPNLDVSVSREFLLSQMEKARRSASLQNAFRTKHLNQWVGASVSWMNMVAWQRQKRDYDMEQFRNQRAWIGVDLASKKDVAAIAVLVPQGNEFYTDYHFFVPESAFEENHQYRNLAKYITVTPGSATDYAFIQERIEQLAREYDVAEVAFDPWQSQFLMQRLMERGLPVTEFPHQVRTMSDPMKEVEALILDGRMFHNNPVMDWMVSSVVTKADAKENIYPTKEQKGNDMQKIDGVIALIMAMGRYLTTRDEGDFDEWLLNPVKVS